MECGINLLMHTAGHLAPDQLQLLLAQGPNVNATDNMGRTALHFACRAGQLDNFTILAEREDMNIDAQSTAGQTAMMMAIEGGHIQVVAEALNNNLNPFLKDALGRTAMDLTQQYRDVLGEDLRQLLGAAMDQWMSQTSEDDRTGAQIGFSPHFEEFRQ